ncbi:hypothetical protein KM800_08610 [Clostridium tyrobutyricum]|uniref:hypothetical protein n=1 Tax=Clostridium tyrobutyricum TaxID=1519 RepID=UPI001C38265C|nr:hypothetical protein [Clostridium tyrobutyricum]MBV4419391.1 hypothetical protein [Clostridium tyrobutyricum]
MFEIIKYDLKAYYKDFLIMICAMVLLNLALGIKVSSWGNDAILGISMMISFAASVVVVIWNIALFARDIYGDSGYLLFTTPRSGSSILGSKIITAILQCIIIGIVAIIITFIWTQVLQVTSGFVFNVRDIFNSIFKTFSVKFMILGIIAVVVSYISFLLTVYLAVTLSKVAIKSRKIGKLGSFIIFIVLVIAQARVETLFAKIFPQTFKLNVLSSKGNLSIGEVSNGFVDVNISLVICTVAIVVAMFYIVAYLLENKLDL